MVVGDTTDNAIVLRFSITLFRCYHENLDIKV